MKIRDLVLSAMVAGAFALLPPAMQAAVPSGGCTGPSAASSVATSPKDVDTLLRQVRFDAGQAKYHADRLRMNAGEPDAVSWVSDISQFDQIRSAVNDMGRQVCVLESMRPALPTTEQERIDRLSAHLTLMADNTQVAITFGNTHRETLWEPQFQQYLNNIHAEAANVHHIAKTAME